MFMSDGFMPVAFFSQRFGRCLEIATELMINEEIRDREVRVIDENGDQLGVMSIQQALKLAEERELDLAKIQPSAQPPVCKLLDYDKYRYEQAKRERENRKNQRVVDIKEVQLSATIEENDLNTKAKMAIRFLEGGDKVKVSFASAAVRSPTVRSAKRSWTTLRNAARTSAWSNAVPCSTAGI